MKTRHTDLIIEDPLMENDYLSNEIHNIITRHGPANEHAQDLRQRERFFPIKRSYPHVLIQLARAINPF